MSIEAQDRLIVARWFDSDAALFPAAPEPRPLDFDNHPVIAIVNVLAAGLLEVFGPCCWAALIGLFLYAELTCN